MNVLIFIILKIISFHSSTDHEEYAVKHFFENIWTIKYKEYNKIEFDGKTDINLSEGHIFGCKKWNERKKIEIEGIVNNEQIHINYYPSNIKIRRVQNSKQLKLYVGSKIKIKDKFIVHIDVYKPQHFVDHYFIKIDESGNLIEICEFNEII